MDIEEFQKINANNDPDPHAGMDHRDLIFYLEVVCSPQLVGGF